MLVWIQVVSRLRLKMNRGRGVEEQERGWFIYGVWSGLYVAIPSIKIIPLGISYN